LLDLLKLFVSSYFIVFFLIIQLSLNVVKKINETYN